ncbi:MAG: hypothetical protein H0X24_01260 [Ktedonobacterales bacterium]|nr:hypothetical protein [Ktedonobacterales bacterium]
MNMTSCVTPLAQALTLFAQEERCEGLRSATVNEVVACSGLSLRTVRVLLERLVAAGFLIWYGPLARCTACGTLRQLADAANVCSCGHPDAHSVIEEAYRLVQPLPALPQQGGRSALTLSMVANAVAGGSLTDGYNGVYNAGAQLPGGHVLPTVLLAEPNSWLVTPILGRIAFEIYDARTATASEYAAPRIAADLGGWERYAALRELEAGDPDPAQVVALLDACSSFADLPRLPALWSATAAIGRIGTSWDDRSYRQAMWDEVTTDVAPMLTGSCPMTLVQRSGTLYTLPEQSAWRLYSACVGRFCTIFAFPLTHLRHTPVRAYRGEWCLTTTHLLLRSAADALAVWQSIGGW